MAEGEPFEPSFAHAVDTHKLIQALEQSSETGTAVRLTKGIEFPHAISRLTDIVNA
jgi:hypothetical protein